MDKIKIDRDENQLLVDYCPYCKRKVEFFIPSENKSYKMMYEYERERRVKLTKDFLNRKEKIKKLIDENPKLYDILLELL